MHACVCKWSVSTPYKRIKIFRTSVRTYKHQFQRFLFQSQYILKYSCAVICTQQYYHRENVLSIT